jgi:hypothetical protein
MHGARDELLARTGFTGDQHGAAGGRHELDAPDDVGDPATAAHDAISLKVLADHC